MKKITAVLITLIMLFSMTTTTFATIDPDREAELEVIFKTQFLTQDEDLPIQLADIRQKIQERVKMYDAPWSLEVVGYSSVFKEEILDLLEQETLLLSHQYSTIVEYSVEEVDKDRLKVLIEVTDQSSDEYFSEGAPKEIWQMLDDLYEEITTYEGDFNGKVWEVESMDYPQDSTWDLIFQVQTHINPIYQMKDAVLEYGFIYPEKDTARLKVRVEFNAEIKAQDVRLNDTLIAYNAALKKARNDLLQQSFNMKCEGLSLDYFDHFIWVVEDWVQWCQMEQMQLVDFYVERDGDTFSITIVSNCYRVRKGDTLSEIAEMYRTTVKKLMELNGIKDPDKIYVDDRIIVQ